MKRFLLTTALQFLAASALAGGSNLAWNDCLGGGGALDRTVACTNSGSGFVYVSLNPSQSYPSVAATDVSLHVAPASGTVGTWWNSSPTGTRWGHSTTEPSSGACHGWWQTAPIAFAPSAQVVQLPTGTMLRVRMSMVVQAGAEQPMEPGTEYFLGALELKFSPGTAGNAECEGGATIRVMDCPAPCGIMSGMSYPGIVIYQPNLPDSRERAADVSNCVTFRNSPNTQCPGATPTQKSTWGSIKVLYR